MFNEIDPRVYLLKLFWCKFTYIFCKLNRFTNIGKICSIAMKKGVSKFMQKSFLRLTPGPQMLDWATKSY
jgi:hypothetical protein